MFACGKNADMAKMVFMSESMVSCVQFHSIFTTFT